MLINKRWVLFEEVENKKTVYFFKKNYDLIISINGNVERGNWELIDNNYLSIKTNEGEFMFKKDFNDDNLFALKKDNVNEYAIFINETIFDQRNLKTLISVNVFLEKKYEEEEETVFENLILEKKDLKLGFKILGFWIFYLLTLIIIIVYFTK